MRRLATRSGYALLAALLCTATYGQTHDALLVGLSGEGVPSSTLTILSAPAIRGPLTLPPGEITLKRRIFRGMQYSYNGSSLQPVFTLSGLSLKDDFEAVISQHPQALDEVQKTRLFNGVALGGGVLIALGGYQMLRSSIDQADEINRGNLSAANGGNEGFGTILLGAAISVAGSTLSSRALKRGVRVFNEGRQAPVDAPPPAAPAITASAAARLASPSQRQDVVHLTNGNVVRGTIVEQVPNEYLRIETPSGNVFDFQMIEVERIAKAEPVAAPAPELGTSPSIQEEPPTNERNRLESWYTHWGLGITGISYPAGVDPTLESLRRQEGVSNVSISMDYLGFYWPRGERTLLGGTANAFGEGFEAGSRTMIVVGATIAASGMHFFQDRIGSGPFVRADVGPAFIGIETTSGSTSSSTTSETGFGWLIGGGYGLPITPGTRLLLQANYASRQVEGDTYSNWAISLGGLF